MMAKQAAGTENGAGTESLAQVLLETAPICCSLWDRDLRLIGCNREAVHLFGLSGRREYLERFAELSPEYQPDGRLSAELAPDKIRRAFAQGRCRFEWMHQKRDGEPIPAEVTLVRVGSRGGDLVAGYTRDLREYEALLAGMRRAEDELRLARARARESARAKSEFLANMSHEIRTPMNGVLGLLHLLLATDMDERQRDYLEKAQQSARELLRIVNDVLDFSRIEAGKLELERAGFSIARLVEEIRELFAPRIREKGLRFRVVLPEKMPDSLTGDTRRLRQVLVNLLDNALKFTARGEVTLRVELLREERGTAFFRFCVADTGIGLTEEQAAGLFHPFTQADSSLTRPYGGTGLGLAICKNLVDRMGGEIWVKSEYGRGCTFFFTAGFAVPGAEKPEGEAEPEGMPAGKRAHRREGGRARILLVEDNEINRMIAVELLRAGGYGVEVAANGRIALEMVREGSYDLVLMDIQMPVMDGLTAAGEIRRLEELRDLPVIAMSAHAMKEDREKSLESGMNDHLTKPIDPAVLYEALERWLEEPALRKKG